MQPSREIIVSGVQALVSEENKTKEGGTVKFRKLSFSI